MAEERPIDNSCKMMLRHQLASGHIRVLPQVVRCRNGITPGDASVHAQENAHAEKSDRGAPCVSAGRLSEAEA